jgi:hypothetical protein
MQGGELDGSRVLEPSSVRAMLTPQVQMSEFTPGSPWWVGLVVELQRLGHGDHFFGHGGAHPWGWWSDCRVYPAHRCAVVVFTNKWDMLRWHNPAIENAHGFIGDHVASWLGRQSHSDGAPRSWSWKASYAVGLVLAERTHGFLGVTQTLSDAELSWISSQARFVADGLAWEWQPEAFRLGYEDVLQSGTTPDDLSEFVHSSRMRIEPAELRLLCHQFGRRGPLSIPMGFFAGARGIASPWATAAVADAIAS